jgi:hypothetical protein
MLPLEISVVFFSLAVLFSYALLLNCQKDNSYTGATVQIVSYNFGTCFSIPLRERKSKENYTEIGMLVYGLFIFYSLASFNLASS